MPGTEQKKESLGIIVKRELFSKLYNYISHSIHVWEHSQLEGADEKLALSKECQKLVEEMNKQSTLYLLCVAIFQFKKKLLLILPSEANPSFNTSMDMLNEIINFCYSVTNYKVENHY